VIKGILKKGKVSMKRLLALWRDERGQDFIEYALIVALVATGTGIMIPLSIIPAISNVYSRINFYLLTVGGAS
jgi:Flp pilus assembly pilin Flp